MNLKEVKAEVKKLRAVHCPKISKMKKAELRAEYMKLAPGEPSKNMILSKAFSVKDLKAEVRNLRETHCPPLSKMRKAALMEEHEKLLKLTEEKKTHRAVAETVLAKTLEGKEEKKENKSRKTEVKKKDGSVVASVVELPAKKEAEPVKVSRSVAPMKPRGVKAEVEKPKMETVTPPAKKVKSKVQKLAEEAKKHLESLGEEGKKYGPKTAKSISILNKAMKGKIKAAANPWLDHLKKFRAAHPEMKGKEVMEKAKSSYEKTGYGLVRNTPGKSLL